MLYTEAGTYAGDLEIIDADQKIATLKIPEDGKGKNLHVILSVSDVAELTLTSYKRMVIEIQ
jgi:hypothetical protein